MKLLIGIFLILSVSAQAMPKLKMMQVTDGSRVDLIFDGKIQENQIKKEFFNDIIQLILTDVSVYPARINSVSGADLTKVFAYQYSPRVVRCRLTIKGKAEDYQNRIQIKASGKILSIKISEVPKPALKMSQEEQALLDQVIREQPAPSNIVPKPILHQSHPTPIATGKPLPGVMRIFGIFGGILLIFGMVVFFYKRARGRNLEEHQGFSKFLGKISAMGFGKFPGNRKLIEVVANHYLGPKKSIAVVKIGDRQLVLGITQDSINLISQMEEVEEAPEPRLEVAGAHAAGPAIFPELLHAERSKTSVRTQIHQKLEGMKPL